MLNNNVDGALEAVNASFEGFFADIFTGSTSALGAFANFSKGIARYAEQLAAKLVATKIFDLLLTTVAGTKSAFIKANAGAGLATAVNGGPIGFDSGGLVLNGMKDKDTVHAKLARGEFVLQRSAVDSLGLDFVSGLNKRGTMAMSGLGQMPVIAAKPSRLETNVYVVPEGQKPTLGANDILVTVADDIVRNGEIKRLIKHVAAGG